MMPTQNRPRPRKYPVRMNRSTGFQPVNLLRRPDRACPARLLRPSRLRGSRAPNVIQARYGTQDPCMPRPAIYHGRWPARMRGREVVPRTEPTMSRLVPALLLIVLVTGCEATKPAANPVASPTVAPVAAARAAVAPATQPATVVVEDPGTTPQSLATDAAAYARAMEKQLDQRQHPKPVEPKPVAAKPRVESTDVQWLDTREFRLTLDAPVQPISASHAGPFTATLSSASFNDIAVPHDVKPAPATQPVAPPQPAPAPSDELEAALSRTIKTNPRDLAA